MLVAAAYAATRERALVAAARGAQARKAERRLKPPLLRAGWGRGLLGEQVCEIGADVVHDHPLRLDHLQ
jgi:hypothetical protein